MIIKYESQEQIDNDVSELQKMMYSHLSTISEGQYQAARAKAFRIINNIAMGRLEVKYIDSDDREPDISAEHIAFTI